MHAVLVDALVDSRQVQGLGLSEEERRIIKTPVVLSTQVDMDALRRKMGSAQARIGQSPEATKGGNATKRIRLRLEVPGYQPSEASGLLRSAPEEMRGRVTNTVVMAATGLAALSPLIAGLLVQHVSGAWAVGAFAATMATAAVLCLALPGLRQAQILLPNPGTRRAMS